jgi:hypothetical protein
MCEIAVEWDTVVGMLLAMLYESGIISLQWTQNIQLDNCKW